MPLKPSKGGGESSTKASVGLSNVDNTSDANKPISNAVKAVFDVIDPYANSRIFCDFNYTASADIPKPIVNGILSSGTVAYSPIDALPHIGVATLTSSTTANSGGGFNLPANMSTYSVLNQFICCFKTPATIDTNSTIIIGAFGSTVTSDRHGLIITGTTAVASVVYGGSATATGTSYTVAANTWYICKVEFQSASKMVVTLYNDSGTSLYTYTANTTLSTSVFAGIRGYNSGTTAVSIFSIDYIDYMMKTTGRVKV